MADQNPLADLVGAVNEGGMQTSFPNVITPGQAKLMGKPEWAGMNRQDLQTLLNAPIKQAEVGDIQSQTELRKQQSAEAKARAELYRRTSTLKGGAATDARDKLAKVKVLGQQLSSAAALMDPELRKDLMDQYTEALTNLDSVLSTDKTSAKKTDTKQESNPSKTGKIKVKRKSDGLPGTIDAKDFNAKLYDKI